MGLQTTCWLMVCMIILPSVAAYSIECSFGFTEVNCRENTTTQKILIGVGVVLSIIVVGGILSCCCCGCCAWCRSEPRHSTVLNTSATTVVPINYAQPVQRYPVCQGYQPVPLQLSPAQLAMNAAHYPTMYAPANQNPGQPPSYQEAASVEQPLYPSLGHPSYLPGINANDNPSFDDSV